MLLSSDCVWGRMHAIEAVRKIRMKLRNARRNPFVLAIIDPQKKSHIVMENKMWPVEITILAEYYFFLDLRLDLNVSQKSLSLSFQAAPHRLSK